eukprot:6452284-Prymnesium_polylepis.1
MIGNAVPPKMAAAIASGLTWNATAAPTPIVQVWISPLPLPTSTLNVSYSRRPTSTHSPRHRRI